MIFDGSLATVSRLADSETRCNQEKNIVEFRDRNAKFHQPTFM